MAATRINYAEQSGRRGNSFPLTPALFLRAVHSPQFLYSLPQSRRDCVLQPRVASSELPWVNCVGRCQPQRGCGLRSPLNRRNPVGVDRTRGPFLRVARCSQPWALSRNPVGIRPPDSSSCGERSALGEREKSCQRRREPGTAGMSKDWRRNPLSPRERAEVRGKATSDRLRLPRHQDFLVGALV